MALPEEMAFHVLALRSAKEGMERRALEDEVYSLQCLLRVQDGEILAIKQKFREETVLRERYERALNAIAVWSDGPTVNGGFDEPGSAGIARKALSSIQSLLGGGGK